MQEFIKNSVIMRAYCIVISLGIGLLMAKRGENTKQWGCKTEKEKERERQKETKNHGRTLVA